MNRSFPFTPAHIQVVPVDGQLAVLVNPREALANLDAPEWIAEVLRGLGAGRGMEVHIYAGCVQDALEHALTQADPDENCMFTLPVDRLHQALR